MERLSAEEKANTWTHLVALIAMVAVAVPLMNRAVASGFGWKGILGTALYIAGAWMMYGASTLYHVVSEPRTKSRLRILDHISIYVMIAGSYSPVCLTALDGTVGWALFAFLWTCVMAGAIGKIRALGRHPNLSLTLYLLMGWAGLLVLIPMWRSMPHSAFWWIIAEGVFYSIGAYFFRLDEEHAFYHAVWHIFIMLGTASHTIAIWHILS